MISKGMLVHLISSLGVVVLGTGMALGQIGTGGMRLVGTWKGESESLNSKAPISKLIAAGPRTVAVRQDGSVYVWGDFTDSIQLPLGLTGVIGAAGNDRDLLLLKSDQSLVCLNRKRSQASLADEMPIGLKATQIAVGSDFGIALKPDGKIVGWGRDSQGAASGIAAISGVVQIAAAGANSVALKSDGTIQVFGSAAKGKFIVPKDLKGVTQVAISESNILCLKSDGTVQEWGDNAILGVVPPADLSNATQIATGSGGLSFALRKDGKVIAWAPGGFQLPSDLTSAKQIISGSSDNRAVILRSDGSISVLDGLGRYYTPGRLNSITQIDGDLLFLATLDASGKVSIRKDFGNLGTYLPVGLKDVVQVSVGREHSLALLANGTVVGWGDNKFSQLDNLTSLNGVKQVVATGNSSFVLFNDGTVKASGENRAGETAVPAGLKSVIQLAATNSLAMALKSDGSVVAWGSEDNGRRTIPASVSGVSQIVVGDDFALALLASGKVIGWGNGLAAKVPADLSNVSRISACRSASFAIALKNDGATVVLGGFPSVITGAELVTVGELDGAVQTAYTVAGNFQTTALLYGVSIVADKFGIFQGNTTTATLTLPIPPTEDTDVPITCSSLLIDVPPLVRVKAGARSASFTIGSPGTFEGVATITAKYKKATAMTSITVWSPNSVTLQLSPTTVKGGTTVTATANLAVGVAPKGGVLTSLSSDQVSVVVPPSVTIPEGQKSATFTISTSGVAVNTVAKITAKTALAVRTATLTVQPATLSSLALSPSELKAGAKSSGIIALDGVAPTGGIAISLVSNNKAATLPATITIPAGSSSASFDVLTSGVINPTTITITAKAGSISKTVTLIVNPPLLTSQTLSASTVKGDDVLTGTVTLDVPAVGGGVLVALVSDNAAATVPATVLVPEGKSTATFLIETNPVVSDTTVSITAKLGTSSRVSSFAVAAPQLSYAAVAASRVTGGTATTCLLGLDAPAPAGGVKVTLQSNDPSVTVPTNAVIPEGSNVVSFPVTTKKVTTRTRVVISATTGSVTRTTVLTLNP